MQSSLQKLLITYERPLNLDFMEPSKEVFLFKFFLHPYQSISHYYRIRTLLHSRIYILLATIFLKENYLC